MNRRRWPNPIPSTWRCVPDRVLVLGQTLEVLATASDNDAGQILTYELGAGAPPGVVIDPSTGRLTWTPSSAFTTNELTVTVTDSGRPRLSASRSFSVTVLPPPQLLNLALEGTTFTFSFAGLNGQTYQLEYKNDLNEPLWLPLGSAIPGTGAFLTLTDDVSLSSARFYRLRLLP